MLDARYPPSWETWLQKWFPGLLIVALLVNAGALFIPILEPDGALYATIARTIVEKGDYLNLWVNGTDWLDKPHFPFWMAAFSMRIFGIDAFAYKLPALLFWAMGAWYTYKFVIKIYGTRAIGQLAVLIYVSAAHLVISNNDVRAEPYLTGLVIGAVYHFHCASGKGSWLRHIMTGALLSACAMMTKGPFVLITIGAGFLLDWIIGARWRQFTNFKWYIALSLIAIFILPELYCLYIQFDSHPEKKIFGRTGVSGLKFFFWDSQFGRFLNTGPIRGDGDPFFYFHTLLWAFLPWSLLLYAAIIRQFQNLRRHRPGELIALGTSVLSFAMFSISKFQLPHYLNILFPFFSILVADWLYRLQRKSSRRAIIIIQHTIVAILPLLLLSITWFYHFTGWPLIITAIILITVFTWYIFRPTAPHAIVTPPHEADANTHHAVATDIASDARLQSAFGRSFATAMLVYAFVNFLLYPAILQYQAGTQAGEWLGKSDKKYPPVYMVHEWPINYSFEFYYPGQTNPVFRDSLTALTQKGPVILFLPRSKTDSLRQTGRQIETLRSFSDFHISQLTGEFINYRTRDAVTTPWSLVRLY